MLEKVLDGEAVQSDLALQEYLRWRYGEPLATRGAQDLASWAWRGFSHLCRTWGKEGRPTRVQPATETVQAAVARLQQRMNTYAPGSQSAPVMHGLVE